MMDMPAQVSLSQAMMLEPRANIRLIVSLFQLVYSTMSIKDKDIKQPILFFYFYANRLISYL
jgi:hypothetical protein